MAGNANNDACQFTNPRTLDLTTKIAFYALYLAAIITRLLLTSLAHNINVPVRNNI